jgi:YVTN family beta-propeller protein
LHQIQPVEACRAEIGAGLFYDRITEVQSPVTDQRDDSTALPPVSTRQTIRISNRRVRARRVSAVAAACLLCLSMHASAQSPGPLPGMPPLLDPQDVYAGARAGRLSPTVQGFPDRIYVPNSVRNTVDVIDPHTFKVIDHFAVGRQPQHVVPSYDLKSLWVLNDLGDQLTRIDPATGKKGDTVSVNDPYNMYYTPDGKFAIVVAERLRRLDFRDAQTMKLVDSMKVPCRGVNHMDFSPDGRYLITACEFSGLVIKADVATHTVLGTIALQKGAMPQDVRLSPDGRVFYVADMMGHGVHVLDGDALKEIGFIPTGKGAHGLYFSRDSKWLYVSNRDEGSVSVIDVKTRTVAQKWTIPGGGSPDMGGVSADGKVLWLSGRYNAEVYAFDTGDGHLLARIPVQRGPHGLCIYPQPGRYSLGHTGNMR